MLFYLCGSDDAPHGGVLVAYRHVDILNKAGIPASVVHGVRNFRPSWFENSTNVVSFPLEITDKDVLVIPEHWNGLLTSLAPGVPKVSFNQSAYYGLLGYPLPTHPYLTAKDLLASLSVSEHDLDLLEYMFPGIPFSRIHLSIDAALFHPPDKPPGKRIAYMTRKRPEESRMLLDILRSRSALKGWETVVIDRLSHSAVARTLRSSSLFLSFGSQHESFALAPLEAIACGCSVIGYTGFGAREYFEPLGAVSVADGDIVTFAKEVQRWIGDFDADKHWLTAQSRANSCLEAYSPEQEVNDVISFWSDTLSQLPESRGIVCTIRQRDVRRGSLRALIRRSAPYLQAGIRELRAVSRSSARS